MLIVAGLAVLAVPQRQRLASLVGYLQHQVRERQIAAAPLVSAVPPPAPPKPTPLRPTDCGVYAVVDDKSLAELQLLTARPPDIRVAVSAAFKAPDQASLPDGLPKFIVFRRDAMINILKRAEVRLVAKSPGNFQPIPAARSPRPTTPG